VPIITVPVTVWNAVLFISLQQIMHVEGDEMAKTGQLLWRYSATMEKIGKGFETGVSNEFKLG
jgi:hypothetical protein